MIAQSVVDGIEGIVLDAVGTLIDPEPSVALAYTAAARRQGVELDPGEVKRRFGRHFRKDEVDEIRGPMRTDEELEWRRWRRIVGEVLPEVPDPERAFAELWDHFGCPDAWRVFPDAASAVRRLAGRGLRLQVGSNFDRRLRAVVEGLPPLRTLLEADALVISSEIGCRKPHPEFYRVACERLGLAPARVLCVGDDPENDVAGPRRAGLRAVLIDRHGRRPADVPALADLDALATLLGAA